jgi:hypothetical protein
VSSKVAVSMRIERIEASSSSALSLISDVAMWKSAVFE